MLLSHLKLALWSLILVLFHQSFASKYERELFKALFANYDNSERPVEKDNDSVNVVVGMALQQIIDLDEKNQILTCSGWMDYGWTDVNLKWNPEEFGNITNIRVDVSKIWIPDILLYNSAADSFDTSASVNAVLDYQGNVKYLPPTMFKSTCQIAIKNFPFDEQICELKFGSWTYDESKVSLAALSDRAQTDTYKLNGEWDLIDVTSKQESVKYDCCAEIFPFVKFFIHIRRRTLYFIFNLIFPCALISLMTVLGFSLPPEGGKVGLEITNLLSIIMFLQLLTSIIPESSQAVPTIGVYFASVMLICAISVVVNVVILVFNHRNVTIFKMPPWIRTWICGRIARMLGMKLPDGLEEVRNESEELEQYAPRSESTRSLLLDSDDYTFKTQSAPLRNVPNANLPFDVLNYHRSKRELFSGSKTKSRSISNDVFELKMELLAILKELKGITKKISDNDEDAQQELEWQFAGMVLDRLCLWIFLILTVVSTGLILLTEPNFFNFY